MAVPLTLYCPTAGDELTSVSGDLPVPVGITSSVLVMGVLLRVIVSVDFVFPFGGYV